MALTVVAQRVGAMRVYQSMRIRSLLAAAAILIVLGPLTPRVLRFPVADRTLAAAATAIPIQAAQRRIGRLEVLEAWRLTSPHSGFGGWSALALTAPRRFLLVSDSGWTARFALGATGAVEALRIEPLPGTRGITKSRRDVESIAIAPNGDVVAGFENTNKLRRYDAALTHGLGAAKPTAMADWSGNAGPEAMTRLADGRWLVVAEGPRSGTGRSHAVVFDRVPSDPAARQTRFDYDSQGKGAVTDIATLRDGRVVIVHRRFRLPFGFSTTIAIADPRRISGEHSWTSQAVGTIDRAPLSDNFEGIAIDPDPVCDCVWIVSDDNRSSWQQSLLLKLRLPPLNPTGESQAQKRRR